MRRLVIIILFLSATAGCMAFYQPAPSEINDQYYNQIKEWQNRINSEGWGESIVKDVVNQCIRLAKYRKEKSDHWDTPREFMERGFQGDCEDIAVFIMATMRRLNYPHKVRILAVKTLTGDHAILRVETPDGQWKVFETVPMPLGEFDRLFYRPIVEFDEKNIVYFNFKNSET